MPQLPAIAKGRALPFLLAFLVGSAVYLFAFPQANLVYAAIVLLHVFVGLIATTLLVPQLWRNLRAGLNLGTVAWLFLSAGAAIGIFLIYAGTARAEWKWLYAH